MELKLGDFGLATKVTYEGEKKRTICGTPNYIAPEILSSKTGHSYEVDVWSIGVIIYTLLFGRPPFETSDVKRTYKRIKANDYTFPEHVTVAESAKDLIKRILKSDPKERVSLDEIASHEFLQGAVPDQMPTSTLACPPSKSLIDKYVNLSP